MKACSATARSTLISVIMLLGASACSLGNLTAGLLEEEGGAGGSGGNEADPTDPNDPEAPASEARFQVATGSYVGNGATQEITGLGFAPSIVWIKGDGAFLQSQFCGGDEDGFSLSNGGAQYNQSAKTYYYLALGLSEIPDALGVFEPGETALSFAPALVMSIPGCRGTLEATDWAIRFEGEGVAAGASGMGETSTVSNPLLDLRETGFLADASGSYLALPAGPQIEVGSYAGDNSGRRVIATSNVPVATLMIRATDGTAFYRWNGIPDDAAFLEVNPLRQRYLEAGTGASFMAGELNNFSDHVYDYLVVGAPPAE